MRHPYSVTIEIVLSYVLRFWVPLCPPPFPTIKCIPLTMFYERGRLWLCSFFLASFCAPFLSRRAALPRTSIVHAPSPIYFALRSYHVIRALKRNFNKMAKTGLHGFALLSVPVWLLLKEWIG